MKRKNKEEGGAVICSHYNSLWTIPPFENGLGRSHDFSFAWHGGRLAPPTPCWSGLQFGGQANGQRHPATNSSRNAQSKRKPDISSSPSVKKTRWRWWSPLRAVGFPRLELSGPTIGPRGFVVRRSLAVIMGLGDMIPALLRSYCYRRKASQRSKASG